MNSYQFILLLAIYVGITVGWRMNINNYTPELEMFFGILFKVSTTMILLTSLILGYNYLGTV
jgi:hypothetical protein